MQLREIMTTAPDSVSATVTITDAAKKMQSLDVGFLPVSEDGQLIGVITDRDITVRAVAEGRNPEHTCTRDVMTPSVEILPEEESVEATSRLMKDKKIRRVLVRNGNGEITGVVSLGDIAVKTGDHGLYAEALEEISRPAEPAKH